MALVRGPFTIKWGENTIENVEELNIEHEVSSDDFETLDGRVFEIDGSYKVTATLTLLSTDVAALAVLLPQHFKDTGEQLSTGETVNGDAGAIDIVPAQCSESIVYNNLDIIACGTSAQVARIVNARTKIDGIEVDNKLAKIMVKFVGEPGTDEATMQFFAENSIAVVS
jgi:hypothetical protein